MDQGAESNTTVINPSHNTTISHVTVEQSLDKYITNYQQQRSSAVVPSALLSQSAKTTLPDTVTAGVRNEFQNLNLQGRDNLGSSMETRTISDLCKSMTHLRTTDFADYVIGLCNHITSLALNEIESLCAGLQMTSLNEKHSIAHEISVLCLQVRQLEIQDVKLVVDDLSCKLSNLRFHDYHYNTFISINQLLTRLSSAYTIENIRQELGNLQISEPSFEDQYQLTCRMLRYILTTSPTDGRVLATYMQQLRIFDSNDYY